jgi:DNA-directed RNA polymerase I, II, and III subunit RPABC2
METVRFSSKVIHPEVQSVSREEVDKSSKENRVTLPYYTKYEYTALVGVRAQELADGAKPLVSLNNFITSSPRFVWEVAEREILEKKLPFIIHRRFPNGISEYWSTNELNVMW